MRAGGRRPSRAAPFALRPRARRLVSRAFHGRRPFASEIGEGREREREEGGRKETCGGKIRLVGEDGAYIKHVRSVD